MEKNPEAMNTKRLVRAGFVIAAVLIIAVVLLSPITKWYIQKHSEEWTGRKITIEKLRLNPFRGSVTIKGLTVLEQKKDEVFFRAEEFYVNVELFKALRSEFEITEVSFSKPEVVIIQTNDSFNFNDLVSRFAADSTSSTTDTSVVKYWLKNIAIRNGAVTYRNTGLENEIKLTTLNVDCPLIAWNSPRQHITSQFMLVSGGVVNIVADVNTDARSYNLTYDIRDLNVDILHPYVKDYLNTGPIKGLISTSLQFRGNMDVPEEIAFRGLFAVRDLSVEDPQYEALVGLRLLEIDIDTVNVKSDIYNFKRINLNKPFLRFELFDEGNNFSKLVNYQSADSSRVTDSTIMQIDQGNIFELLASYVRELSEKYVISNYKADSVSLSNGTFRFNDYTMDNKFNYVLENLEVSAERISSKSQNLEFNISSILNTSGKMNGSLTVNPDGFRDIKINYTVADLKISDFNPYSSYYVAHPFVDGVCYYTTNSSIDNRFLRSDNNLEIRKIIVGKKEKNATAVDLPIRLAVALLRDVNGNIVVDVPVEGNLDDPKYRLGPIIWQVFKNLILKAVAAPGKLLAKKSGVDEKYLEGFEWQLLQTELDDEQKKALDAVAKTLTAAPEMNIEFVRIYNVPREMDQIALQESKKRFLFFKGKISREETVSPEEQKLVDALPSKDSAFTAYVDNQLQLHNSMLSIYDKSRNLVGSHQLYRLLQTTFEKREEAVTRYLTEVADVNVYRFRLVDPKEESAMPYSSFSHLKTNFYLADEDERALSESIAEE